MDAPATAAIAAHRDVVREMVAPGGPLATDSPHSTMNNPAWFEPETGFTPARRALHRRLLAEHGAEQPDVRHDRRAVVLAGPPGAGKSRTLDRVLGSTRPQYLRLDADDFKKLLLEEAVGDGSLESFIKPAEVRHREQAGERFFPLELAALVHEESSLLAKRVYAAALREGANLIIDGVLSKPEAAAQLGAQLAAAGYQVQVIDVECTYEASLARIAHRWELDYRAALEDGHGLGGRWVPSEYVRGVFGGPQGRSWPEEAARQLAETCPAVTHYDVYRVAGDGAAPERVIALGRRRAGGPLVDIATSDAARRSEAGSTGPRARDQGPGGLPPRGRGLAR